MFRVIQSVLCYGYLLLYCCWRWICASFFLGVSILCYVSIHTTGGFKDPKKTGVEEQKTSKNSVTHKKWCVATKRRGGVAEGPRGGRNKKKWFDQQNEDILDQQKEDMRPKDMWTWVLI